MTDLPEPLAHEFLDELKKEEKQMPLILQAAKTVASPDELWKLWTSESAC